MTRLAAVGWVLVLGFLAIEVEGADPPASAPAGRLEVRVDPRVELLSVVFRLAGHPEYNMPNSASAYAEAVEAHFGKFRDHPAVQKARDLRRTRGISYDAVMSLAVHLADDATTPAPRAPLEPRPPLLEGRWTPEDAAEFIKLLGAFVRDSDFAGFLKQQDDRYRRSAEALGRAVNRRNYVGWFDGFFGSRPQARFAVIVGMLNGGGNYGVSFRAPDGREEITPVIGIYRWTPDGLPAVGPEIEPTVVHEFCHAYTNAVVDRHWNALAAPAEALFDRSADAMRAQAYGTPRTLMYETLVRGCVALYMQQQVNPAAGRGQAAGDMVRGFTWTAEMRGALARYAADRKQYPTFDAFMPEVVATLKRIADDYDAHLAKFPRLKSIDPPDGATDVDPAIKRVVITFDRPMLDGTWSITGGGPEMPQFERPRYDAARKVLTVPVALEPGRSYRFGLNGGNFAGFMTPDGYPLQPVEVRFATRP